MNLILYSFIRCPFAIRVRMALHERNLSFAVREEDLKNLSSELGKLHPEAKVPLLVHDALVIYDSAIINEYLEEAFPETVRLMPESPEGRAAARMWTHWCNQLFKIDVDKLKYGGSRFPAEQCVDADIKVQSHLKKLEAVLEKQEWLLGKSLSLADVHVFPFVRQLFKVTPMPPFIKSYPSVTRWLEQLTERDSFKKAMAKT